MYRFILLLLLSNLFNTQPIFAQTIPLQIKTDLTFYSKKSLDVKNIHRHLNKGMVRINLKNSSSQLSFNYGGDGKYTFDGSYLEHTSGIITLGIGALDRNWSFSNNTSLILSHNARPIKSIYIKLENRFGYDWLPSKANWSLNVFNGFTEGSLNGNKSMLLGARAMLSTGEGLDIELIQASQWGGKKYKNGISALSGALFTDTNVGSNSNINKMGGFGISYLIPINIIPLRIYGQVIGEDEAGSLPSCNTYLAGLEWINTRIKYPTTVGVETIDTRIDATSHGNCGPNTMYNNSVYDYTNYGKTMGAAIDAEGTSLGLYVRSQISEKINIEFATKSVVINDDNWSEHRLSKKRQSGFINSLGVSWVKNNINFHGEIYNQSLNLDKANIFSGYGVGFSSSILF